MEKYITHEEFVLKALEREDFWLLVRLELHRHENFVRHNPEGCRGAEAFNSRNKVLQAIGKYARHGRNGWQGAGVNDKVRGE